MLSFTVLSVHDISKWMFLYEGLGCALWQGGSPKNGYTTRKYSDAKEKCDQSKLDLVNNYWDPNSKQTKMGWFSTSNDFLFLFSNILILCSFVAWISGERKRDEFGHIYYDQSFMGPLYISGPNTSAVFGRERLDLTEKHLFVYWARGEIIFGSTDEHTTKTHYCQLRPIHA